MHIKFLERRNCRCLNSCLPPDPLGERGFVLCPDTQNTQNMRYIDLLLANQIAHIFRANDNNYILEYDF